MVDLSIDIAGLRLKNPVMPASGTFSEDLAGVFDLERLGAHVTKTITRGVREGNPTPRVCEAGGSMLNSIGIPSKGATAFLEKVVPFYRQYETPLVVSISGNTADEFAALCEQVSVDGVAAIEVNISCPNVEEDGKAFAIRPSSTYEIMQRLSAASSLPLWAKLTPNCGEVPDVAKAAEDGGADALVVSNTILSMAIDIQSRRPKLGNLMGGLSGPCLKPIALRMAYQCARAASIPVIGCGGISTAEDVIEYMMAGASAVQVGTATFIHPTAMLTILEGLEAWLVAENIASVRDLIGCVIDGEQDLATSAMAVAQ
ncbi:dihydroorotate dehydrogenase [Roseibium aggregatum]|uniref:Dihydroorotate dehydrogenase n=1 Tax=Roseibium aggregatum TaxID=187304 RepID=A0A0M6YBI3_9HYPH|nr:dihydroorotate dehydrogenase [Roseibium aggregatum]CTQ47445.1 Dihydroorotate dehydrogenase B (NAD(+)), catalytic subunit [Roseibium aggregatum]